MALRVPFDEPRATVPTGCVVSQIMPYASRSNPLIDMVVGVPVKPVMKLTAAVSVGMPPLFWGTDPDVSITSATRPPHRLGGALGSVKPPL